MVTIHPRFLNRACCLESCEDENRDDTVSENNVLDQNKSLMNYFTLVQRALAEPLPCTRHGLQGAVQCERTLGKGGRLWHESSSTLTQPVEVQNIRQCMASLSSM